MVIWLVFGALVACNGVGCKNGLGSFMRKHENPVLATAPRRVDHIDPDPDSEPVAADPGSIVKNDKPSTEPQQEDEPKQGPPVVPASSTQKTDPADTWENWEDDTAIFNSKVAATVNGAPILNGEVLDRYSGWLISVREEMQKRKMPPSKYNEVREMRIKQDLMQHIHRKLLVERMRGSMKADQIKQINAHIDAMFDKEVDKLKRELKVSSRTELELELNKKGTTLQNVRDAFANEQLAGGYYQSKLEKLKPIERSDIIGYYQSHPDEFAVPARVHWEQIQIDYGGTSGRTKDQARQKVKEIVKDLGDGSPFADLARKQSTGPTAKSGGQWEMMDAGSLADTKLEQLLFEIPIEQVEVYEGKSEFQIVRVHDRTSAGKTPVGDVQEDIRKKLEQEQLKNRPRAFMEQLVSDAVIESKYFDQPQKKISQ